LEVIGATVVAFTDDDAVRERWRLELHGATESGWFNPADPQELLVAVRCLLDGGTVPDFPRSG
jgi:hypothetical protein